MIEVGPLHIYYKYTRLEYRVSSVRLSSFNTMPSDLRLWTYVAVFFIQL